MIILTMIQYILDYSYNTRKKSRIYISFETNMILEEYINITNEIIDIFNAQKFITYLFTK